MTLKQRYNTILKWFEENMPDAETELKYTNPYELLVAVILSAQCTDKRINMVTPPLFERYPVPELLAAATFEEVEPYIRSVTFANNKTRHLIGMAQMLINDFNGEVPDTINELIKMPGVGRKTANVIISVVFGKPGMAVDTHVFRVSARIGLTKDATTPLQTEQQLVAHIPKRKLAIAHHWLILHGRYICVARNPKCEICGIKNACRYYETDMKYIKE
ncbi:MAG: endonuclease III [Taibaiella sp.]|nr:endonuclease III [Taibaiella sp.]